MPQMQKDARVCRGVFFLFQRGFFGVSFPNFIVYVNGGARGRVIARGNFFSILFGLERGFALVWGKSTTSVSALRKTR